MVYRITWSPSSKNSYFEILDYLDIAWGTKERNNFIARTEEVIYLISTNPFLYPPSKIKANIHRCVVAKQVNLFYQINQNHIELLLFWDNRKDPKKLEI